MHKIRGAIGEAGHTSNVEHTMHTDSRGYAYETYRDGGRVCRRYIGRADWAGAAIYLQRLDRERDEEKRRHEREQIEKAKALRVPLDAYCRALDSLVSDAMTAAGYHRHKRGAWRKRRAQEEKPMSQEISIPVPVGTNTAERRKQLLKAQKDSVAAAQWLDSETGTLGTEAEVLDILAPILETATTHLTKNLAGENALVREAHRRQLKKTVREVAGPNPTPLEIQLAQRVAVCELSVTALERLHSGAVGKSLVVWEAVGRQLDAAHRRHLSAVKALASVRRAQLPDVQINIGEKQVNIGNISTDAAR